MCDFFEGDDFIDEHSFEDSLEGKMDEPLDGESECDDEPDRVELQRDDFEAKDAFILGGAMGFAYEQGLRERKRKKRK